jgi:hypothetical protein
MAVDGRRALPRGAQGETDDPADAARMRFKPYRHALEGVERAERVLADARSR